MRHHFSLNVRVINEEKASFFYILTEEIVFIGIVRILYEKNNKILLRG
jgi:hypothetical protein